MRILYEDTMPHAGQYFSQLGEASPYTWQTLKPEHLRNTDVLAIRSTTKVTPDLLSQADNLHTVATATAGTNHMDIPFLENRGTTWYAAGGCNAIAVAQYVVSAILYAHDCGELDYTRIKVGIIGAGNVGSALSKYLESLAIPYVLCDPPIEHTDPRSFVPLQDALACDVVSLHMPYVKDGIHPTGELINAQRLARFAPEQWLINACRGEVIDEKALLAIKKQGGGPQLVLDVWNNEPDIDVGLMSYARLATPHIAGHTDEGKIRGTQMVYDFLRTHLNIHLRSKVLDLRDFLPAIAPISLPNNGQNATLSRFLQSIYDIQFDHRIFVQNMAESKAFSALRKHYQGRREYDAYSLLNFSSLTESEQRILRALGFRLTD